MRRSAANAKAARYSLLFERPGVKLILQAEAAECGLASLAMVANYHGSEVDLNALRHRFPISLKGCNLHDLAAMAHELQMTGRALRLELSELDQLARPCILHWDMSHFVVLTDADKKHIEICDPAFGKRRMSLEEASKHFTGIALELHKRPDFAPSRMINRLSFQNIFCNVSGISPALLRIFVLSLTIQLFNLSTPIFTQLIFDEVVVNSDQSLLTLIALAFVAHSICKAIFTYLRSWSVQHLSSVLNIHLATGLFEHLLTLSLDFFQKRHIGDIVSRFQSLGDIKNILSHQLVAGIIDGLMAIATLALMIVYAPLLTLVVVSALTVILVGRTLATYKQKVLQEEALIRAGKEKSNFLETIRSIQSIKLAAKEADRKLLWANLMADVINSDVKMARFEMLLNLSSELIVGLEFAIILFLGAKTILLHEQSIGTFVAYMAYQTQFKDSLLSLSEKIIHLRFASLHLDRISDIVFGKREGGDQKSLRPLSSLDGSLAVRGLSFRYSPWEPYVLSKLNLDIKAGESVAIVAPSGAGKSTLLKVMLGLLEPVEGTVLIDGIPLHQIDPKTYRQNIAAVMQDDQLLSGSIADNIVFFAATRQHEHMIECAKLANIYDDIMAMPMRFNTLIGDMGSSLSGGQKQRVMLARALYRRPKILFLDEATSHLDSVSESKISANIRKLKMTRVMIAHRRETLATAERIIYLNEAGSEAYVVHGNSIGQQPAFV